MSCFSQSQKPQPPLLLKKVWQYTSNLYRSTSSICIAVLLMPLRSEERETLSVLLPFVSQYAPHLYRNTPSICIAVLLGKSWWLWSPGCSPVSTLQDLQAHEGNRLKHCGLILTVPRSRHTKGTYKEIPNRVQDTSTNFHPQKWDPPPRFGNPPSLGV